MKRNERAVLVIAPTFAKTIKSKQTNILPIMTIYSILNNCIGFVCTVLKLPHTKKHLPIQVLFYFIRKI